MPAHHFFDLAAHGVDRIQRQQRFLEHHGHHRPAHGRQFARVHRQHVAPVHLHPAAHARAARRMQPHQRAQRYAFARARFAHQRHRFTAANGEVQRLHRAVRFGAGAELHAQAFNRQ
ncbi:hypothetical protein G6F24_018248 [Rhizopus arrhizus]|nr:hypothetical protein G6F24_018248 [Rhizopus arrhizus]